MTLSMFNAISLDGYFVDAAASMMWAHEGADDPEFAAFTAANASAEGALLFGRVTYEGMAAFWTSPDAKAAMPEVAAGMGRLRKYVASRTLQALDWENATLLEGDLVSAVRALKQAGPAITILGSGRITAQLTEAGVIDSYTFVIAPIVLGGGRTLFEGVSRPFRLTRVSERAFNNGRLVVTYARA